MALPPSAATADAIAGAVDRLLSEPAWSAAAGAVEDEIDRLPTHDEVLAGLLVGAPAARAGVGGRQDS